MSLKNINGKQTKNLEFSDSHGGEHDDGYLLGYWAA
jgi:hypothetical protein